MTLNIVTPSKTIKSLLFTILYLGVITAHAASVLKAEVNRKIIAMGESLVLTLSVDDSNISSTPNLKVLEKKFNILGTSQSTKISINNGDTTTLTQWNISLAPRAPGKIIIPEIRLGQYTSNPIEVTVSTAKKSASSDMTGEIFLTSTISSGIPYVQSQVIYTIRVYYAKELINASLDNPTIEGATVTRLGEDKNYRSNIKGVTYRVIERRYAIVPDKSGELIINSPVLTAREAPRMNRRGYRNFLSNIGRPIRIMAEQKTLLVKPIPPSMKGQWWLPAENLILSEKWPSNPPKFRVGEPVTRTIMLQAKGITASQLPEIEQSIPNNLKNYPDKPTLQTSNEGNSLIGTRIEKIALIPSQSGEIYLPEVTIPWWNTITQKKEVARIPARTIHILPATADGSKAAMPVSKVVLSDEHLPINNNRTLSTKHFYHNLPWMIATLLVSIGWLLTLIAWRIQKRKNIRRVENQPSENIQLKRCVADIKTGCKNNNPTTVKNALVAWGKCLWINQNIRNLRDIEKLVQNDDFNHALNELDKLLYAGNDIQWNGDQFWKAFCTVKVKKKRPSKNNDGRLPKLYPEY